MYRYLAHDALKRTSREKIEVSISRLNKCLKGDWGDEPLTCWTEKISSGKEQVCWRDGVFEYIYRCYHRSFKVGFMAEKVRDLLNMIVYLFSEKMPADFYEGGSSWGFGGAYKEVFGGYRINVDNVFAAGSDSHRYAKDVLERTPESDGGYWDYEDHHLAYMGGALWSVISSVSLLGILKAEAEDTTKERALAKENSGAEQVRSYMTFPRGVAEYLIRDINFEALSGKQTEERKESFAASSRKAIEESENAICRMYIDEAKRQVKGIAGLAIEDISCRITEAGKVSLPVRFHGVDLKTEILIRKRDGWALRIDFGEKVPTDILIDDVKREGFKALIDKAIKNYEKRKERD